VARVNRNKFYVVSRNFTKREPVPRRADHILASARKRRDVIYVRPAWRRTLW
jgi:hypothetical protein